MEITKLQAIKSLTPNAEFVMSDDVITEWHSEDITQPTDEVIATEQARLQAEYDDKQYQRNRAIAYASIQDQLDMMYWDGVNGTTTWQNHIAEVKANNPKP